MTEYKNSSHIMCVDLSLKKLIRFLLSLLLVYEGWYIEKYGAIPFFLQGVTILIVILTFFFNFQHMSGKVRLISPVVGWLAFGIVALLVGAFSQYSEVISDAVFTYLSFLVVCICGGIVSKDGNDTWLSKAVILTTLLCIISVLIDGFMYKNGDYYAVTMGENNNPNTLGMMMAIGVYFLLNPTSKKSRLEWTLRAILSCMCVYIVIGTGSRSSLLCLVAVVGLTLYFRFKCLTGDNESKLVKRLIFIFGGVIALYFVISYIQNVSSGTSGINRLLEQFNINSYGGRIELYVTAWMLFKEHPIFGVGYKCFEMYSQFEYFTHSTYMELLSCTGLVGFFLFMGPVIKGVINSIKCCVLDNGRTLTMLLLFVVGGFFGILYYNLVFMMLLYMTILKANNLEKLYD